MKILLLTLMLLIPQQPLEPTRVSITLLDENPNEYEQLLAESVRQELRQLRSAIITTRQGDLNVFIAATTIPDGCSDYAATFLVIRGDKSKPWLIILAGKRLQPMAKEFVKKLEREFIAKR